MRDTTLPPKRLSKILRQRLEASRPKRDVEIPELEPLDFPALLPGEVPVPRAGEPLATDWYAPDGHALRGGLLQQVKQFEMFRTDPDNHFRSRTFYRAGVRLLVSTAYLGLDHNYIDIDTGPLIWETMVFAGDGWHTLDHQWRYTTRGAALHGHRQVTLTLRLAQAARRAGRR